MKNIIAYIGGFTIQNWLNIIFAIILYFGWHNYTERVSQLEEDVRYARDNKNKLMELYIECIEEKYKHKK